MSRLSISIGLSGLCPHGIPLHTICAIKWYMISFSFLIITLVMHFLFQINSGKQLYLALFDEPIQAEIFDCKTRNLESFCRQLVSRKTWKGCPRPYFVQQQLLPFFESWLRPSSPKFETSLKMTNQSSHVFGGGHHKHLSWHLNLVHPVKKVIKLLLQKLFVFPKAGVTNIAFQQRSLPKKKTRIVCEVEITCLLCMSKSGVFGC